VHLGLALGFVGAALFVAPFDFDVWVVAGPALGVVGFAVALTGGAQGERDPALERALQRAGLRPTLRAVAASLVLVGAVDLCLLAPWRERVAREYVASRQALLEQDGAGLREALARLATR
jgi:hypothetical protein